MIFYVYLFVFMQAENFKILKNLFENKMKFFEKYIYLYLPASYM